MNLLSDFIQRHQITEVECLVPDMSGIARGKILPAEKFLRILRERGLRMPEAIFIQTVTGEYPDDEDVTSPANSDIYMRPDENTIRLVPWYTEATAQVISDCDYADGSPVDISPRWVLKRVLELYDARGWQPIVAPELEFFLVQVNKDPDYPLVPPVGRSGRTESGRQAYGIDAVNEFDPIFEDVYDYCEAQRIDIDTLTHEAGAAQIEINFNHGDPLELADQVFLFKRTVRETAIRHNVYATFMAKPMQGEPGSAMHVHQSVVEKDTGRNLFSTEDGEDTPLFLSHIARPSEVPADRDAAAGAQRQFLPPADRRVGRADQRPLGPRQPHHRLPRAGVSARNRAVSRTAWPEPTPTPIWRWPPHSPAAISA